MKVRSKAALLVTLAAWATACGDDATTGGQAAANTTTATSVDKSGAGAAGPLTITVGTENEADLAENEALVEFRDQVDQLSGGSMKVEIKYALEVVADPPEPLTARAVESGTVDMALTGATAWGTDGVTSLQALQAPFLVRSHDQAMAVLRDDALQSQLLSGLAEVGVVGIALFPEDFRLLIDYEQPLTDVSQLDGSTIRTRLSAEIGEFYESLGMTVEVWNIHTDVREFTVDQQEILPKGTVVGNLPVYFRFGTLVANQAFWNRLDREQQAVLTDAASAAKSFAVDTRTEDRSMAEVAAYCERGGLVNWLDEAAIERFQTAAQPTIDLLKEDPETAGAIATIADLGSATPTAYPQCGAEAASASSFPEGVYRYEITMDDLLEVSADQAVDDNLGIYTFTLNDGTFTWEQQTAADNTSALTGEGTYTVDGNLLTMTEPGGPDLEMSATVLQWSTDADGSLIFILVDSPWNYTKWVYGEPWIRIGDAA
jgi:TRAP-type C4-dicarboxylate transport system substrate-binding protein